MFQVSHVSVLVEEDAGTLGNKTPWVVVFLHGSKEAGQYFEK